MSYGDSLIAGGTEAEITRIDDEVDIREVLAHSLGTPIRRGIVNDDDLEQRCVSCSVQRGKAIAQKCRSVEAHNDDRDARRLRPRHGAFPRCSRRE